MLSPSFDELQSCLPSPHCIIAALLHAPALAKNNLAPLLILLFQYCP